ncbi:MAG: ABC transporter substrate-binding protein [Planctomycetota bacterium]
MIYVGIDDTDTLDSPGTNQLARAIVRAASDDWRCVRIVRHQLFFDPRVPYTSKNGSASISLEPRGAGDLIRLTDLCERVMRDWFVVGSDPGLCVTDIVPDAVTEFGRLCQRDVVTQAMARELATAHQLRLRGLGGTEGGVIGALAAVGLAITGDDGRVVQHGEWPEDLCGSIPVEAVLSRGIELEDSDRSIRIRRGVVDVGKHLRPNRRAGETVLFVRQNAMSSEPDAYQALKLT